ncbi:tetraprenyl-beta-curcumene synthase family protein [Gorillibacterium timonense]|uniref:tetraprenyl-beta-curcumene synthase family protein n=1 Tax=Gorillibacterium timonense TaxID=1689269 RepID=UPI00071C92ED|nr:tetraprenyl-beta-curcumene synthase family protein [Gorillibacterium timonense]
MTIVYRHILPGVKQALAQWEESAGSIPDPELKKQAIASIQTKRFHCQGGAVYAAANLPQKDQLISLIVAFQTISDYLDNLCDRSTSLDPVDFRQLHQSMLDAVTPELELADYYAFRTEREDGGYLIRLVEACRTQIAQLPSYRYFAGEIQQLVSLYVDLQVYKHIRKDLREDALTQWWEEKGKNYPDIRWNEFAAATGSTLGVFMLFLAASEPEADPEVAAVIGRAYFPYVCALHIQLDYLIDQEEDRQGGDLNFCFYYGSGEETVRRMGFIAAEARKAITRLKAPRFHRMIIEGLIALYLSDPKVASQPDVKNVRSKLLFRSPMMRVFFLINSVFIRFREPLSKSI